MRIARVLLCGFVFTNTLTAVWWLASHFPEPGVISLCFVLGAAAGHLIGAMWPKDWS